MAIRLATLVNVYQAHEVLPGDVDALRRRVEARGGQLLPRRQSLHGDSPLVPLVAVYPR